ncbi:MAG TPA: beta-ketoacyl-[acyl-carrier-protein] synthase family protein [Flavobacteriaceae bacterium]|nr:beta-ketoacyl-[acyl-carrier-protein] synthase family protein [Flavobacteriaceae bacterium]
MKHRVVITGMGIVSPNGIGIEQFSTAIRNGKSGIRFHQELADLNFGCQIGGKPQISQEQVEKHFTPLELKDLNASGIKYGVLAGMEAWENAKLPTDLEIPDFDNGIIFGAGISGVDKFREAILKIDARNVRRLGSSAVIQTMASGISAYLNGKLGCGNQVTTNSSACVTGTEAILMGYDRIKNGQAKRMLVGSCGDFGPYIWGGFDALRILPRKYNGNPPQASRPMSASASGFVPGSGAGALLLESLESAQERGATVYAEILGGTINSGGQQNGGSMTASNNFAVQKCIHEAMQVSGIAPKEIDAINGHLTATRNDPVEIENWKTALNLKAGDFPFINSLKGMTGHCLSAAGSIECVASVLQLHEGFLFGNINCEDLHPEIKASIPVEKILYKTIDFSPKTIIKASFGFGDVNACVVFRKEVI